MTLHFSADPFASYSYRKALTPALVSSIGLAIADMADAVVLGQQMGATGLAAVNLALPLFMIFNLVMHGLGAGGAIRFSQFLGAGQQDTARKSFSQVIQITLFSGILIAVCGTLFLDSFMPLFGVTMEEPELYHAAFTYIRLIFMGTPLFFLSYLLNYYLRNDDNQVLASRGFTVGNFADLGLNIVFVLGLNLGVVGVALATILGNVISIVLYLPGLFGKSHALRYTPCRPSLSEPVRAFSLGSATSIQYIYQLFFYLIVNHVLIRGAGENGVAIFNIVQNVSYLVLYLYDGVSKASQPLISTYSGERNRHGYQSIFRMAFLSANLLGVVSSAAIALLAPWVCVLFGLEGSELIAQGNGAIHIYCISLVFAGSNILLENYYQALGAERRALLMATLRGAIVLIPCTLVFSLFDIAYFWWVFAVVEILSCALFALIAPRWAPIVQTQEDVLSQTIPCRSRNISELTERIQAFCQQHNATGAQTFFAAMAVEEICLVALENVFGERDDGVVQVTVIAAEQGDFELHIRDNGNRYDPFEKCSDPSDPNAMGIEVIRRKCKSFFYRHYQGFNTLTLTI